MAVNQLTHTDRGYYGATKSLLHEASTWSPDNNCQGEEDLPIRVAVLYVWYHKFHTSKLFQRKVFVAMFAEVNRELAAEIQIEIKYAKKEFVWED